LQALLLKIYYILFAHRKTAGSAACNKTGLSMNDLSPAIFPHTPASRRGSNSAESLLKARYRDGFVAPAIWNETLDLLLSHRSVRAYLPNALPDGTLEALIAAAQSAASSSNLQAWSVIAVEDSARKARLAALAGNQKHIAEAPLLLVWLADLNRLGKIAAASDQPAEALEYFDSFLVGVVDAALAAQNAVVALESLGLGGVYIGALRNKPLEVAAELGLPPNVFALFGLVVGHPDPSRPADVKPRLPQRAVFFREQYGFADAGLRDVQAYNERVRAFQLEQNLPQQDWSTQAGNRMRNADSMNGRHILREVLNQLGFGLK
jgi:nitroreductase